MRSLVLLLAAVLLSGCTLTIPLGAAALNRPVRGAPVAADSLADGAFVILATTDGREREGLWQGHRTAPDGSRSVLFYGLDNRTREYPAPSVAGVYRARRRPVAVGRFMLAGAAVDAVALALAYRALVTCCNADDSF